MIEEKILGTIFLFLLHPYLWMTWAKKDYFLQQKNIVLLGLNKRLLLLIYAIIMTILSIYLVKYYRPESNILAIILDSVLVYSIAYYRIKIIPNKKY